MRRWGVLTGSSAFTAVADDILCAVSQSCLFEVRFTQTRVLCTFCCHSVPGAGIQSGYLLVTPLYDPKR